MKKDSKIYLAGHTGLAGTAILKNLRSRGYSNFLLRTIEELDLTNQGLVNEFFEKEKPEYVIIAAARVGGILSNMKYPAEFAYSNLMIQCNIIHASYIHRVKKLMFLGSSCIYPRKCAQPMKEEYLLTGEFEPTNEAYALAKVCGLRMCQYYKKQYGSNFISCMPTNLYGPGDNFNLSSSHVIPAMMRKMHEAKVENKTYIEIWGTGKACREFLHVDDMADACVFLLENYDGQDFINVGTGKEICIKELSYIMKKVVGYEGDLRFDTSKPDGNPRKLLDVTLLNELGWRYRIELEEGLKQTYEWLVENMESFRDE